VPPEMVEKVAPLGHGEFRAWGDQIAEADLAATVERRAAKLQQVFGADIAAGRRPTLQYLAISGGGQWGAFGAGVLKAWTASGTRPEFFVVSGISTGALIAPFAFLGPQYDATLETIYKTVKTDDLLTRTIFSGITSGTSLADTAPLARMIATYITPELLAEIAQEYRRGRDLLVGTTNLDASRPVIWDMGAIAASGDPGALALFRSIVLASASIPVAFPPVFIEVTGPDGSIYDEMHVDGGATSQVTLASPQLAGALASQKALRTAFHRKLYVLMNNDVLPVYTPVRPRLPAIGSTAISSLIRAGGIGDVYKLYTLAAENGVEFKVAWIPTGLPCAPEEAFDPDFMTCLFAIGEEAFRRGTLWREVPPFHSEEAAAQPPRS
ncbi:MAG TPA: patatin-like phospholipase family protein, partial [Paracoccaceae bacterium]|nr:patatin-like phospholipase family protein [Paracoccaceae bacterium]